MENVEMKSVANVAELLSDVNAQRPYIAEDGLSYITQNSVDAEGNKVETAVLASNAATLRKDEWEQIDATVVEVAQKGTPFVDYCLRHGLTYNLADALGTMELGYEVVSDMQGAYISMDGAVKGKDDTIQYDIRYMPIPIIQKEWTLNLRRLLASRKKGEALDTVQLRLGAKKVKQFIENLFVKGEYTNNGHTLQGLTKFAHRNVGGATKGVWTKAEKTGAEIFANVQEMIRTAKDKGFKNGYVFDLFINAGYEDRLDQDYAAGYPKSIRERLKEIGQLGEIVVLDELGANEVVLLPRSKEVIEAVLGMPMTVTEDSTSKGYIRTYNIQEITLPRFKADYNGDCGIVHWTITD